MATIVSARFKGRGRWGTGRAVVSDEWHERVASGLARDCAVSFAQYPWWPRHERESL